MEPEAAAKGVALVALVALVGWKAATVEEATAKVVAACSRQWALVAVEVVAKAAAKEAAPVEEQPVAQRAAALVVQWAADGVTGGRGVAA